MRLRSYVMIAALWLSSLAVIGVVAQDRIQPGQEDPRVIAGPDIGFRVDRTDRGTPVGRLVVRVNGQWVEASFGAGPTPVVSPR